MEDIKPPELGHVVVCLVGYETDFTARTALFAEAPILIRSINRWGGYERREIRQGPYSIPGKPGYIAGVPVLYLSEGTRTKAVRKQRTMDTRVASNLRQTSLSTETISSGVKSLLTALLPRFNLSCPFANFARS